MAKKYKTDKRDLAGMTVDQLEEQLEKYKREQFNLRFQKASGQLEATHLQRRVRKNIAIAKTYLNQKRKEATAAEA